MKKLISRYFRPFQWLYKTFTSNSSFKDRRAIVFVLLILCVWLVSVIFVTSKHEYFRDEVRALSLMQDVNYPGDIYDLTQFDGHPPLWFFLLYVVWLLTDSQLVLPMLSILIATAAVIVFMFYGPFQLWLKCLFIFEAILRPDQTFDLFMPHWIPNLITIVLLYFLILLLSCAS